MEMNTSSTRTHIQMNFSSEMASQVDKVSADDGNEKLRANYEQMPNFPFTWGDKWKTN